jgi:hypothetical protein
MLMAASAELEAFVLTRHRCVDAINKPQPPHLITVGIDAFIVLVHQSIYYSRNKMINSRPSRSPSPIKLKPSLERDG